MFNVEHEVGRQLVACAVCAGMTWIDAAFPCAMWLPHPGENVGGQEDDNDQDDHDDVGTPHTLHPGVLCDNRRCYFGPAKNVDEIPSVDAYHKRWPLVPPDDLHASSVEHPRLPK